jgi:uncharacterized membrane protein YphA (DoxX/SURF4 family)
MSREAQEARKLEAASVELAGRPSSGDLGEMSWFGRAWNHWIHSWLGLAVRLVVGVVFIYAAYPKIARPGDFAWNIAMYQYLHYSNVNMLAIILPWVEMICGVTLIVGLWTRGSAVVVCGMCVMFIIALVHAITHEIEMTSCGCFSQEGAKALAAHREEVGTSLLYRDILMLFATGYVWLFDSGRVGLDGLIRRWKNAS